MKKFLLLALLPAIAYTQARADASILTLSDTITDSQIVVPESFDSFTRDLQTNWYLQRYMVLDSMAQRPVVANVSDAEYIDRLQRLPTVIEMPYNSIVRQYIEMYAMQRPALVEKMLSLSLYYGPIFEDALERYGLPTELKYLPIIESALNPNAVSKAGAAGLWQFMPSTATGEGLEVNSLIDERRDPFKSSEAAASLLKKFYDIYHDWHLVLAAYNCGPGNVNKAMNASGRKNFWEIYSYLPKETRGYVPAFIAATYIMHNFGHHGISPAVARYPIVTDTVMVSRRVHFDQISAVMDVTVDELRVLNPQYRTDVIPGNIKPCTLILPSIQAYCYKVNEDSIVSYNSTKYGTRPVIEPWVNGVPAEISGSDASGTYTEKLVVKYHTVKRGETLKSIAALYGVTQESIRAANNMTSSKVKRGKKLKINTYTRVYTAPAADMALASPVDEPAVDTAVAPAQPQPAPAQKPAATKPATQKPAAPASQKTYAVKSGDTLGGIAAKHGVSVDALRKANGLKSDVIHPGQKLSIPAPAKKQSKASRKTSRR